MVESPYFALVNNEYTTGVRLSNVIKYAEYALPAIDCLMKLEEVYGQRYLFEDDLLLVHTKRPVTNRNLESPVQHKMNPFEQPLRDCIAIDRAIRHGRNK